jgi:hypothetical protein
VRFTESYLKKGLAKPLNRRDPLIDRRVVDRNPPRPSRKPADPVSASTRSSFEYRVRRKISTA